MKVKYRTVTCYDLTLFHYSHLSLHFMNPKDEVIYLIYLTNNNWHRNTRYPAMKHVDPIINFFSRKY